MNVKHLYKNIDYQFSDENLLTKALTHRSVSNKNNERLEYLGDSIVNFVIAEALFNRFPETTEGQLSRMRASLVKKETLAIIAKELKLGKHIYLGSGELKSGGYRRESILADTVEALIAAIYLDSNLNICKNKILAWFTTKLDSISPDISNKDAKTELQEYLQSKKLSLPKYEIIKTTGKDHEQIFFVSCEVSEIEQNSLGQGSSRRHAEQAAARQLLQQLESE